MPDVPGPEELLSEAQFACSLSSLPSQVREHMTADKPIEIRPVLNNDPFNPIAAEPRKYFWFRSAGTLPDDQVLHRYVLAYASDFELLSTSLLPHAISLWQPFMQFASLDHAIWFHDEVKVDDWL